MDRSSASPDLGQKMLAKVISWWQKLQLAGKDSAWTVRSKLSSVDWDIPFSEIQQLKSYKLSSARSWHVLVSFDAIFCVLLKNYRNFTKKITTFRDLMESSCRPSKLRVHTKSLIFLFLNQNICCGYSKEPPQWEGSFEHGKHLLKLIWWVRNYLQFYGQKLCLSLDLWKLLKWTHQKSIPSL